MNALNFDNKPAKAEEVVNGLSVDVEDWFQVGAFEDVIERGQWSTLDDRVDRNVRRILDLFDEAGAKGTFFTLGWVAQRHGSLLRDIAGRGHEIASHGWDHQRVFRMNEASFAADIASTRKVLEDASGTRVVGYRAPSFSIDARTPWAHEALVDAGYLYSSSVAPIAHDHYGWREAPRFAFKPVEGSNFVELPVTTAMFRGKRLAAGGGGFFRVLPYAFSRWAIRQVNRTDVRPAIFYFHPWEIDPGQPRVAGAPLRSRLRHYTNLGKMSGKLEHLVREFHWGRMDGVAKRENLRLRLEKAVHG
ncbi:XrtA system polysaccharide deacetylase [Aurantiacibacter odishensis]|uniref:XrtA system polysaccharide deacetylase n=1 Tax=Aurantiacibacter odishensis TaxID=1155476 RepID=UPI001F0BD036|nr:XrtA system polysaccharide deacetylase [Aurantiacibacter odishensis]